VKKNLDVVIHIEGRDESPHVRGKNPEQRHPAQNVDEKNSLSKTDRADTLGFLLHVRTPELAMII
jgi:hypothetical protein